MVVSAVIHSQRVKATSTHRFSCVGHSAYNRLGASGMRTSWGPLYPYSRQSVAERRERLSPSSAEWFHHLWFPRQESRRQLKDSILESPQLQVDSTQCPRGVAPYRSAPRIAIKIFQQREPRVVRISTYHLVNEKNHG